LHELEKAGILKSQKIGRERLYLNRKLYVLLAKWYVDDDDLWNWYVDKNAENRHIRNTCRCHRHVANAGV